MTDRSRGPSAPAADPSGGGRVGAALAVVIGAHLVLIVWGQLVLGIGGWRDGTVPTWGQLLATSGFWVAGLVLAQRWWRGAADPLTPGDVAAWRTLLVAVAPWRRAGAQVLVGAALGAATSSVLIPILYRPLHAWWGTSADELEAPARALIERADGPVAMACLVVLACVGAPVVEEVLYRGVLQTSLAERGPAVAIAASAVVFGLAHLQALQLVGLVVFGVVLGVLRWRTGSLVAPIAAHVAFNAATLMVLTTQR